MRLADAAPDLVAAFHDRLRRDGTALAKLEQKLRREAPWREAAVPLADLESLSHRLAGAAGTYGYAPLGEAALRVERLTERWRLRPPPRLTPRRHALLRRRIAVLAGELEQAVSIR